MPKNDEGKYDTEEDLPENLQETLPLHAQHIYRQAFNHAIDQYQDPEKRRDKNDDPEAIAHKVAWAAVKHKYAKGKDGCWHEIK